MLIATLSTIAKRRKTPECPQTDELKNIVYPYNEISFSHKKEGKSDTCYNRNES